MLRILQIDDYVINEVAKVKKYAFEHPYDESYRALFLEGKALPIGDNPEHVVHIHDGYRAVYSVSVLDNIRYHHLSISVEEKNKYPGIPEAEIIMELFDMGKSINDLDNVWIENAVQAVNLLKEIPK
jgi:hypothetical protein